MQLNGKMAALRPCPLLPTPDLALVPTLILTLRVKSTFIFLAEVLDKHITCSSVSRTSPYVRPVWWLHSSSADASELFDSR